MKHSLPFIAVLMFAASSFAQGPVGVLPLGIKDLPVDKYSVLDKARYKFSYTLTCVYDTLEKKTITNDLILLVGSKYSKMFNNYPPHPEIKSANVSTDESRGLGATEVYKDLKKKRMLVTTRVYQPYQDVYVYEEELPKQSWMLTSESKSIYGYKCQKATTRYLGRDYEAWYTLEIPISNGPWKLGGLPGMILEAYDTQRHYVFSCAGIRKLKEKEEIVKYDWHYVDKSRQDLLKLMERFHDDPLAYLSFAQWGQTRTGRVSSKPLPYNPLERE